MWNSRSNDGEESSNLDTSDDALIAGSIAESLRDVIFDCSCSVTCRRGRRNRCQPVGGNILLCSSIPMCTCTMYSRSMFVRDLVATLYAIDLVREVV